MYKQLVIGAALFAGIAPYLKADLIEVNIAVGVVTCTGGNNICSATVNAIGDLVVLDIKGQPVTKLGSLSAEEKVMKLALPAKPNEFKIFSFTPTQGALASKEIYLLIQNQPQRVGTRRAEKTVFKISRQLQGEKPDQWIEIGDIAIDKNKSLDAMPFIVTNEGTFVTFDTQGVKGPVKIDTAKALPEGVKKVEFLAGSNELIVG